MPCNPSGGSLMTTRSKPWRPSFVSEVLHLAKDYETGQLEWHVRLAPGKCAWWPLHDAEGAHSAVSQLYAKLGIINDWKL